MGTYVEILKVYESNAKKKGPTITVSGFSGTGKTSFAKKLAELTGLKYASSGQIFREVAKEKGMSIEEFSRKRTREFDIEIDKRTLELAQRGGYVIEGRMAGLVAGDFANERIIVKASDDLIAKRVAERDGKDPKTALKDIKERDEDNTKKYMDIYLLFPEESDCYTIIIENNGTYKELMDKAKEISDIVKKV